MENQVVKRAGEIIWQTSAQSDAEKGCYCVIALFDEDGYPSASTVTVAQNKGIEEMTFCTGLGSNKAKRAKACGKAGVCFCGDDFNITLVGTVEVLTDEATRHEAWYPGMGNHFSGPDDPDYCVLRFKTKRYNIMADWKEAEGTI